MPYVKVEYASSNNISVRGTDYFEVGDDDLDADGNVTDEAITRIWQDAVNDWMADTYCDQVPDDEVPESER